MTNHPSDSQPANSIPPKPPDIIIIPSHQNLLESNNSYKDKLLGKISNPLGDLSDTECSHSHMEVQQTPNPECLERGEESSIKKIKLTDQDIQRIYEP